MWDENTERRHKRELSMKKKKIIFIMLAVLALITAAAGVVSIVLYRQKHEIKTVYYTEDYTKLYEEELQIIFGEDCRIGEKETITIEGEDCSCGFHSDTYIYDQWEISYKDRSGQEYTQILNNRSGLEYQQLWWLEEQLEQHYKQQFLVDYFEEGTFQELSVEENGSTYCFVFMGNPVNGFKSGQKEEYDRAEEAGDRYEEQLLNSLKDKETMLHLWELDYEQIFRDFPIKVSLHLSIDDQELTGTKKADWEKAVRERVLRMMQSINQESDYTSNLAVNICCAQGQEKLYDGESGWHYYLLQGESIEPGDDFENYNWQLFYSYEGIFW